MRSNAATCVVAKMEELKKDFPDGLDYVVRYDTTPFIRESIIEVFNTLRDAVILVALVVLLFLQNWRSALIPLIAVPVAIIGTFAVMAAMGFSLNNLTLFGLVLAIGIVVDDAIVVVEAVEHHIEHGMKPRAATIKAMDEVSAPVIAVGLVLSAVFVPCAFITGITGQFFRQFALTIASSTIISTFNSLTLSPALAAILLKPKKKGSYQALPVLVLVVLGLLDGLQRGSARGSSPGSYRHFVVAAGMVHGAGSAGSAWPWAGLIGLIANKPINWLLGQFFRVFNWGFDLAGRGYTRIVGGMLRVTVLVLLVYVGMLCLTGYGYSGFPKGVLSDKFIAKLDKGGEYDKARMGEAAGAVYGHAQGIHPFAGYGLPDDQRAIARLGIVGAHVRADEENADDHPGHPGYQPYDARLGTVDVVERIRVEFRLDVRDAQGVRRASSAGDRAILHLVRDEPVRGLVASDGSAGPETGRRPA